MTYLPFDSILPCWKYAARRRSIYWSYGRIASFSAPKKMLYRCRSGAAGVGGDFSAGVVGGCCPSRVRRRADSTKSIIKANVREQSTGQSLTTKSNGRRPSPRTSNMLAVSIPNSPTALALVQAPRSVRNVFFITCRFQEPVARALSALVMVSCEW